MRLQAIGTSLTNAANCVKNCVVATYIEDQAELAELLRPSSRAEQTKPVLDSREDRPTMKCWFGGVMTFDEMNKFLLMESAEWRFFDKRLMVIEKNTEAKRIKESIHKKTDNTERYRPTDKAHFGWIGNIKLMLASLPTTLVQLTTQACSATHLGQIDALRMIGTSMAKFAHALAFAVSVLILLVAGIVEIPFRVIAGGLDLVYNTLKPWLDHSNSFNAGPRNFWKSPRRMS